MDQAIIINSRKHGDRVFHRIGERPYQRKDGTTATLHVWRGACVFCGEAYEVTTLADPDGAANAKAGFAVISCLRHRARRRAEGVRRLNRKAAHQHDGQAAAE